MEFKGHRSKVKDTDMQKSAAWVQNSETNEGADNDSTCNKHNVAQLYMMKR